MDPGRLPGLGRWRQEQDRRARVSLSCVAAWEPTADQRRGRSAGAPRGCTTVTTTDQLVILRVVLAEELVDGSKGAKGGLWVDSNPGSGMLRDGQGSRE